MSELYDCYCCKCMETFEDSFGINAYFYDEIMSEFEERVMSDFRRVCLSKFIEEHLLTCDAKEFKFVKKDKEDKR